MNITILGTGYVGLVTGLSLADIGHNVICVDNDQEKIEMLRNCEIPFYEDGVSELLKKNLSKNINFSEDLQKSLYDSEILFIAVGTPFDGNKIDLTYIEDVSKEIGKCLKEMNSYKTIVVKSTVIPGTTLNVVAKIIEVNSGLKRNKGFGIGMCPEFLREGTAVYDSMNPDRIVIGAENTKCSKLIKKVFSSFDCTDIIETSTTTAELIKYTSNSFLASLISFSNEISNYCMRFDNVDVKDILNGLHLDKRLSPIINGERITPEIIEFIKAGCGFGGSCFPKDVKALIADGDNKKVDMKLLKSVIDINENQPNKLIDLFKKHHTTTKNHKVGVLGLSFKPGTDDMRESPSIKLIYELKKLETIVYAYDPVAVKNAKKLFADLDINYVNNMKEVVNNADSIFIVTSWNEFNKLPDVLNSLKKAPLIIDGRRMLDKNKIKKYEGIGLTS